MTPTGLTVRTVYGCDAARQLCVHTRRDPLPPGAHRTKDVSRSAAYEYCRPIRDAIRNRTRYPDCFSSVYLATMRRFVL